MLHLQVQVREGRSPEVPRPEYADVNADAASGGGRYIVVVFLAGEFTIWRPTDGYSSLLETFPAIFVAKPNELRQQGTKPERKRVVLLTVNITTLNERSMAEVGGDNVYVDWMTGTAPGGLTEGVADYVMVKSGYYDLGSYDKPRDGNRWDEGYGVTARFLKYCDPLSDGFTAELNNKMREVYRDEYFEELLGKPLGHVWREYKEKYEGVKD
ncbi:Plant basic secretory protein (BSP) family protein [Striga hermonthica]|uniref:Plant basic secretory protein (BSP) family protein n=1 Tax=Striga hermonthica TaxID=68872 RepID=A0A9N7MJ08_STRHE|nr:Plant basic secretory protein (BSP) family protein [Striga hermonthica]